MSFDEFIGMLRDLFAAIGVFALVLALGLWGPFL